jgi:hypothetical protein
MRWERCFGDNAMLRGQRDVRSQQWTSGLLIVKELYF